MDAYQAGQQLGTLLFGQQASKGNPDGSPSLFDAATGQAPQGMPYYRTLAAGAQAQNAMQEARLNRAKALIAEQQQGARGRYLSDFQGAGLGDIAQLASDAALGADSSNPNQLLGLLSQARATQAANAPDDATMNRNIAVFAGKPLELSTSNGGITTANPYTAPVVAPNALGDAAIAEHNAQATAANVRAQRDAAGIGADKAGNYDITQDSLGDLIRVNKLTGQMTPVTGAKGPVVGKPFGGSGKALTAADSAYIQKLQRAFAAGKSYAQIAAAAQQDGKLDLFVKHFGKQDVQGEGD